MELLDKLRRMIPGTQPPLRPRLQRRVGPRAQLGPIKLSGRETEVLKATAEGMSLAQMAAELGIAARTADRTKSRLMKKLDVHKSTELVAIAFASGLVPLPDLSHLQIQFPVMPQLTE